MRLHKLSLKDKPIFTKYLGLTEHTLSVYAFENIYIWRGLYQIFWVIIKESLGVFFKDKMGCFLYLPPLGRNLKPKTLEEIFRIMDGFNKNKDISRIENVEAKDLTFYQGLGYVCRYKSADYLCQRQDLVELSGNKFKSKRASFNYFFKNYNFEYLPFSLRDKDDCLKLYAEWTSERQSQNRDSVYQGMLKDYRRCLKILLDGYLHLNLVGRMVKIDKKIKAFTFGFRLNSHTFCILYEITDLSIKGLAQFIFRQFCQELVDYKYINIMDDSGLKNLEKVKLSYRPVRLIPSYIVKR